MFGFIFLILMLYLFFKLGVYLIGIMGLAAFVGLFITLIYMFTLC